jgi:ATP-dependent Clp protease ATP-binding subunit ClpX
MLILKLIYWKIKDLKQFIKEGSKLHLYGIIGIVGLYGGGKTMALTQYLEDMRNKHGDNVYIATNYFYKGQDFHLSSWKQMLKNYDKPIIFGFDELQNEFNSREYKTFPVSLMTILTQNRKGNGKQIIYTTQDYETVDKSFRRLTQWIWACKTRFGRLTSIKQYDREDFEMLISTPDINRRMKIRPMKYWKFIQTDYIRTQYDSYQMLDSALNKTYVEQLNKDAVTA